uniref:Uncharacterized protein n=2 Tax=Odontella aurita TaxID=265563 RepID=A0A7S4JEJ9_9STRA|mmetsp:Transcript_4497/g.12493  ORF Transcript_4497/g.12493 Transcript_4497/m.12493 type:complete len:667 (+) Transcript_4497:178-2178(+)
MYAPHQQPASSYTVVAGDSVASVPYPPAAAASAAHPAAPLASAPLPAHTPTVASPPITPLPPPPPPPPPPAVTTSAAPPVAQRVIRAASSPAIPRPISGSYVPKSSSSPSPPSAAALAAPVPAPVASAPASKKKIKSLEDEADVFLLGPIVDPHGRIVSPGSEDLPSAERKKKLKPPKLPEATTPLLRVRSLVERRAYVDVLAVTSDLLQSSSSETSRWYSYLVSGAPPGGEKFFVDAESDPHQRRVRGETAELIRHRLTAMMKLRRYGDVSGEVERLNLGENDESRGALPLWVPRDLRVMAVASAMYVDGGRGAQRSVDGLHRMREELLERHAKEGKAKEDGVAGIEWLGRVDASLSNAFIRQKEWRLALSSLDDLLDALDVHGNLDLAVSRCLSDRSNPFADPADGARESRCLRSILGAAARIEVRSRQGRILLQSGGCDEAEEAFAMAAEEIPGLNAALEEAEDIFRSVDSDGGRDNPDDEGEESDNAPLHAIDSFFVRNASAQILINEGLLLYSRQMHGEALDRFLEATDMQREEDERRLSLLPDDWVNSTAGDGALSVLSLDLFAESIGLDSDPSLLTPALNNAGLCALYTCRMRDAVSMMESLVRENPTKYLTERMAFNLCTLYELGSDGATSERKKRVLQAVAKRFFLHDIGSECFRIN